MLLMWNRGKRRHWDLTASIQAQVQTTQSNQVLKGDSLHYWPFQRSAEGLVPLTADELGDAADTCKLFFFFKAHYRQSLTTANHEKNNKKKNVPQAMPSSTYFYTHLDLSRRSQLLSRLGQDVKSRWQRMLRSPGWLWRSRGRAGDRCIKHIQCARFNWEVTCRWMEKRTTDFLKLESLNPIQCNCMEKILSDRWLGHSHADLQLWESAMRWVESVAPRLSSVSVPGSVASGPLERIMWKVEGEEEHF